MVKEAHARPVNVRICFRESASVSLGAASRLERCGGGARLRRGRVRLLVSAGMLAAFSAVAAAAEAAYAVTMEKRLTPSGLELTAFVDGPRSSTLHFELTVRSRSAAGSRRLQQSGLVRIGDRTRTRLGRIRLGNPGAICGAHLSVMENGRVMASARTSCSAPVRRGSVGTSDAR